MAAAVLAAALVFPPLCLAAPWVDLRVLPGEIPVLRDAGAGDAQITLELDNRVPVPLRVEGVRFVYFRADRIVAERGAPDDFFESVRFSRERRLDRDGRITWPAVCLSQVPEDADRLRVEVLVSAKRRFEEGRSWVTVSADLVSTSDPLEIALPFSGYWRVTQGNGCGSNHRIGGRGGEFAWDFAAVERAGRAPHDRAKRNEDSSTFGQPVLSPVAGRVIRIVDAYDDNEGLEEYPRRSLLDDLRRPDWVYGNYLVLEVSPGAFVLLAHLEHGSISVSEGATVEPGAVVARSGNSGNSMRPHLHVQAMDRPDPADPATRGIPIRFIRFVEIRGAGAGEEREIEVRKVASGMPQERSVVAPDPEASGG